jgi:P-type Ca2+ transporter type 2C
MPEIIQPVQGLNAEQVVRAREQFGKNTLRAKQENALARALKDLAREPMIILLLVASTVYFLTGNPEDGLFMAVAIVLVAAISLYQDSRSRNALAKLQSYSEPTCKVIRSGEVHEIKSEEIVVGDSLMVEEGTLIVADGLIVQANDFSVNESILTGEAFVVHKDTAYEDPRIYRGTVVVSGLAIATVTAVGNQTRLGQIGESLHGISAEKTPLETQIGSFVRKMVLAGSLVFLLVWGLNYLNSHLLLDSLLKALTLAMSILPEEIPVAFATFMALGAWRLMRLGVVVKQMKTVETLGSATVICTDKTGTITENKMSLVRYFTMADGQNVSMDAEVSQAGSELITVAMWASEPIPFDPMEAALHEAYGRVSPVDERPFYQLVHEYPLGGIPPMMTHVFEDAAGNRIIATKGAPETLLRASNLSPLEKETVQEALRTFTAEGYRVLGVGEAYHFGSEFPAEQQHFNFVFRGLVAFYDPPKPNIGRVFEAFYRAGINIKILTGDNALTTAAIARQVGFRGYEKCITGEELMQIPSESFVQRVADIQVFTRMFPDAKLKVINALKANHEIVAMTGDGVNDGPALKAAHIGIAMGRKGTEIARQAASLILVKDDLGRMVDAIAMGRKIYANLKKAIRYIISIHIPIILTVFIPLVLGWVYPAIFSPVHIIFLELIMGPTCSIIYENEPIEKNTMLHRPRPFTTTFFSWKELATSVAQGLVITVGTLLTFQYAVGAGYNEDLTRTMVFTTLIAANVVLTLVNRSFYYSLLTTLRYKNPLVGLIIGITLLLLALLVYVKPFAAFFGFEALPLYPLFLSVLVGCLSVIWYEGIKYLRRRSINN